MLKQFEQYIQKHHLFQKTDRLLVAFSGGVDSVVLSQLLLKTHHTFDIAHCNFQLRDIEANEDTHFCETYAKHIQAKCYLTYFETKQHAAQHKMSIQMAARDLRYAWFKHLLDEYHYDYILTAHHANDVIETLFVNLIRGTGIKGLQGIPQKQIQTVRPLLFASKEEIINYATVNNLSFREDSSNQEVKYKRNFIRHQIIPELKKLNPSLEETINTSIQFFKQSSDIVQQFADKKFKDICHEQHQKLFINIPLLLQESQKETLLFEWLHAKQFKTNQIQQLVEVLLLDSNTGKQFISSTHQLLVDRIFIIVKAINHENITDEYSIPSLNDGKHLPIQLTFEQTTDKTFSNLKNIIHIDYSTITFPLTLRKWKNGDKFKPLGLNGFKKLSDFFKDNKFSLFEKQELWLLTSKQEIVWVVGHRMDDRFKLTENSTKILKITYNPKVATENVIT